MQVRRQTLWFFGGKKSDSLQWTDGALGAYQHVACSMTNQLHSGWHSKLESLLAQNNMATLHLWPCPKNGWKRKTLCYLTNKKSLSEGKRRYICNLKDKDLQGCDHKVNSHCTGVPQIQQNVRQKWSRQKVQTKMRNFRIVRVNKTLGGLLRKFDY